MSDSVDVILHVDTTVDVPLGQPGTPGKSAYQSWLDEGHTGTVADFLASLHGTDGGASVSADAGNVAVLGTDHLIYVPETGGASNWGDLGGTLSDQTDLQDALNAKADSSRLAPVATSGAYGDLSGKPTLGTASAQNSTAFATAAQGATADAAAPATSVYDKTTADARFATAAQGTKADAAAPASTVYDKSTADGRFATAAQGAKADSAVQPAALGTAAALNVPATGNAATGEVVKGTDTRLSDARTPTTHTHPSSQISDAAVAATASTVVIRDAAGRAQFADPSASGDAATKNYADTQDALAVPKSLVDAKGDLYVGTADNTVARLGVGTDGQVLTADSTQTAGVKWATASGGSGVFLMASTDTTPSPTPAAGTVLFRKYDGAASPLTATPAAPYAFYKLDEASGNFADSSGNSRTLTAGSGVTRSQSPIGSVVGSSVKGSGTAEIGQATTSSLGVVFTLAAWVRIPSSGTSIGGPIMKVGGSSDGIAFGLNSNASSWAAGRKIGILASAKAWLNTGIDLGTAARDVHLAMVYNGANSTVTFYVDGLPVYSTGQAIFSATGSLRVGMGETTADVLSSSVLVDNAVFYTAALTDTQVQALGVGLNLPVGYWDGSAIKRFS